MKFTARQYLGALLLDWPGFESRLAGFGEGDLPHPAWVEIANRNESLRRSPSGPGVACEWEWTSELWAARVFPNLGRRLMRKALSRWPVRLADGPASPPRHPDVSFIVGHRGRARIPLLLASIRSVARQTGCSCELIVVEQDAEAQLSRSLPAWVTHLHTPPPAPDMPYSRAWAFNVGARAARGDTLVLHDGDLLCPRVYAREVLALRAKGFEVMDLKRFIFYLGSDAGSEVRTDLPDWRPRQAPTSVVQNNHGASLAIDRSAFFSVGSFDETFVGWGGEDNEFWDRAMTLEAYPFGYLPFLHLWHPPSERPGDAGGRLESRRAMTPRERVEELRRRPQGDPKAPWGYR